MTEISFRLATPNDAHVETYDNTKLTAFATCPTWGVLRYGMHKAMRSSGRALALECGSAMHEVFAFVRLCQLYKDFSTIEGRDPVIGAELLEFHAVRMFTEERWDVILEEIGLDGTASLANDLKLFAKRGAIAVLGTSGYYDDPNDKKRTLSNMEDAALAYISNWDWRHRVWVRDETDPTSDIGIEIPFDLLVTWERDSGEKISRRFTGKIDGIREYKQDDGTFRKTLEENKTASRLNDAWALPFDLNSQPTGYMIAASVFIGDDVRAAKIMGLSIPLPKTRDYGGILEPLVRRKDHHIMDWLRWFDEMASGYERLRNNPYEATRFTHSCGRYFRPCMFIPFCDNDQAEQRQMVEEMVTDEWSPLEPDA